MVSFLSSFCRMGCLRDECEPVRRRRRDAGERASACGERRRRLVMTRSSWAGYTQGPGCGRTSPPCKLQPSSHPTPPDPTAHMILVLSRPLLHTRLAELLSKRVPARSHPPPLSTTLSSSTLRGRRHNRQSCARAGAAARASAGRICPLRPPCP